MVGEKKICPLCGKSFTTTKPRQKYCDRPHYKPCPVCGKPVLSIYPTDPARCCSKECVAKLRAMHKAKKVVVTNKKNKVINKSTKKVVSNKTENVAKVNKLFAKTTEEKVRNAPTKTLVTHKISNLNIRDKRPAVLSPTIPVSKEKISWDDNNDSTKQYRVLFNMSTSICGFNPKTVYDVKITTDPSTHNHTYIVEAYDDEIEKNIRISLSSVTSLNRYFSIVA